MTKQKQCPFRMQREFLSKEYHKIPVCRVCGAEQLVMPYYPIKCRLQLIKHYFKVDYEDCVGEKICPIMRKK